MDSNDDVFSLKFISKNGDNKGKIYYKMYNNNDLNDIKNKIGVPILKNNDLTETILYSLSKNNDKYNIKYELIDNNENNALNIFIEYKAGMISFNIELNIPCKLSDIDIIKNELKKMYKIISDSKRELTAKTLKIDNLEQQLRELKQELNEIRIHNNDKTKITNDLKANFDIKRNDTTTHSATKRHEINALKSELNEGKFEHETKTDNNESICPVGLNKNPAQWNADDIKGIYISVLIRSEHILIYVVWVKSLPNALQKDGLKIVELGLNGFNLLVMNRNHLYYMGINIHPLYIKAELESWLPIPRNMEPIQMESINDRFNWDKTELKIDELIDALDIYDFKRKSAKIIEIFDCGLKIHWISNNNDAWDQIIYKIHYNKRIIHPCIKYLEYIVEGRVIKYYENNSIIWGRIEKVTNEGCVIKTNFGSSNGITKNISINEYKSFTITNVILKEDSKIFINQGKVKITKYETNMIECTLKHKLSKQKLDINVSEYPNTIHFDNTSTFFRFFRNLRQSSIYLSGIRWDNGL